jgi:hypothetical protein
MALRAVDAADADWPKMLDGRLLPCFKAYWTTSLTSLRQMRAERPAAVMGAPLEQVVSDDAGARRARL